MATANTFEMLVAKMCNIVSTYVKAYKYDWVRAIAKNDMFYLQIMRLRNCADVGNTNKKFVWIVNQYGSDLVDLDYRTILNDGESCFYEIDLANNTCKYIRDPNKYWNFADIVHK